MDFIEPGKKFGLVTIAHRAEKATIHGAISWFCVCECGKGRWLRSNNIRRFPPKTHLFCHRGIDS